MNTEDTGGNLALSTQRKISRSTEELRNQLDFLNLTSDQYRLLVETIGAVIWRADQQSMAFSYVSPQAEKLFYYPLEQWVEEKFWLNILHPEDKEWVKEACEEASKDEREHTMEYRIIDGRGNTRWIRDAVKLHYQDGKAIEKIGVIVDITEEKESREKLKLSEDKFNKAFEGCPIPSTITRLEDSLIINANSAFTDISGYSRDQLIGTKAIELDSWQNLEDRQYIQSELERGVPKVNRSIVMKDAEGKERYVVISATKLEVNNQTCMLAMFVDLTERRKQEKKLLNLNQELETFMYRASHNLRGPVASIKGLLHLAQKEVQDAQACYYLDLLDSTSLTLENTLEELLDITRLKQGKLDIKRVNLEDILSQVCNKLRIVADWHEVELIKQLENRTVYTDYQLLYSILYNILENCVRYREPSRKTVIDIECRREKDFQIIISDNGRGIPESYQEKVFDMFFRANEQAQGTGLGLYIVKNAVEKLGGEIRLSSQLNKGTTVSIQLPDKQKAANVSIN